MKNIFLAVFLGCAATALGQSASVLSNEPQILQVPDHPGHARTHRMGEEQNLRGEESPYTYAQGELPLRDFAHPSFAMPLGDIARNCRKEHFNAKKAVMVLAD